MKQFKRNKISLTTLRDSFIQLEDPHTLMETIGDVLHHVTSLLMRFSRFVALSNYCT